MYCKIREPSSESSQEPGNEPLNRELGFEFHLKNDHYLPLINPH